MLHFLLGKSYYFNSHRICPLGQPHQLRTDEMFPFFHCLSGLSLRYRAQSTWNGRPRVCLCFSKTMKRDTSIQILPGKPFDANLVSHQSHSRNSAMNARV